MIIYRYREPKILFVGINPHHGSARRAVPFSNNKMFWYLLAGAGLLKEDIADLRSDPSLKRIYREKFNNVYRLGFVNIIDRPTRDITELVRGEEAFGQKRIVRIVRREHPPIVCFIGKITYQKFTGSKEISFGWQPDLHGSKVFVMHAPSRGAASVRIRELKLLKKRAKL